MTYLLNANDFKGVAKYLSLGLNNSNDRFSEENQKKKRVNIEVETRPVSTYMDILGGVSV